jgi:hypothetical protein
MLRNAHWTSRRARRVLAFALTASALMFGPAGAQTLDVRVLGAWTGSVEDCPKTFEKAGGIVRFRLPRDQFESAFLVTPRKVEASGGDCRIISAKRNGDVTKMTLSCTDSISTSQQDALVKVLGDNRIEYSANDDPDLSAIYEKCVF